MNERMVREDFFTSVHVDEYILEVRETKRGMEELTSDIPNVSEEATKDWMKEVLSVWVLVLNRVIF